MNLNDDDFTLFNLPRTYAQDMATIDTRWKALQRQAHPDKFAAQGAAANPADAGAMKNLLGAEAGLGGALSRLMVVMEQYPDLKANQNMMQLQEEIASTENRISFARQAYNDEVMSYNIKREVFPNSLIAATFNFGAAQPLELESAAERQVPQVRF